MPKYNIWRKRTSPVGLRHCGALGLCERNREFLWQRPYVGAPHGRLSWFFFHLFPLCKLHLCSHLHLKSSKRSCRALLRKTPVICLVYPYANSGIDIYSYLSGLRSLPNDPCCILTCLLAWGDCWLTLRYPGFQHARRGDVCEHLEITNKSCWPQALWGAYHVLNIVICLVCPYTNSGIDRYSYLSGLWSTVPLLARPSCRPGVVVRAVRVVLTSAFCSSASWSRSRYPHPGIRIVVRRRELGLWRASIVVLQCDNPCCHCSQCLQYHIHLRLHTVAGRSSGRMFPGWGIVSISKIGTHSLFRHGA